MIPCVAYGWFLAILYLVTNMVTLIFLQAYVQPLTLTMLSFQSFALFIQIIMLYYAVIFMIPTASSLRIIMVLATVIWIILQTIQATLFSALIRLNIIIPLLLTTIMAFIIAYFLWTFFFWNMNIHVTYHNLMT
jgi:hypothetical protein